MSAESRFRRVVAHRGPCRAFLPRYRAEAREALGSLPRAFGLFCGRLLEFAADERNLWEALTYLGRYGGIACGPDRLRITDLMSMDRWALVRGIRDSVRAGHYERGPLRKCRIPKQFGSRDKRTIYIATLADRILTRGMYQIAAPLLGRFLDPLIFSQPRSGVGKALAHAWALTTLQGRFIWLVEDARNAFDVVPRTRLQQVLQRYVPNREFWDLAIRLTATPGKKGILQGASMSSLLLDIYLYHFVHRPWRRDRHPNTPLRYADDVLIMCSNEAEASRYYENLVKCFGEAGMSAKIGPTKAIVDLRRQDATWLGYCFRWRAGELQITPKWFDADRSECSPKYQVFLIEKFRRLHERPDGWRSANEVVRGIIDQLAPTLPFVDPQAVYREIASASQESAFEEIMGADEALSAWEAAHFRWSGMAERVAVELSGNL